MTDELPPFTLDTSLDLILLVRLANTIGDLGISGWLLWGHCSLHGDRQEMVFDENPPTHAQFGCAPCYRMGVQRSIRVEDITRI